jgi:hypothetical protein
LGDQGPANWQVKTTTAVQTQNADASILLSDINAKDFKIEGQWTALDSTSNDDDYMGFVFGYQDKSHFYLFDWKQADQSDATDGLAEKGMNVKVVNADSDLSVADLWSSAGNGARVKNIFHNSVPWEFNVKYTFSLSFVPGATEIVIKNGDTILADIKLTDATFKSGLFGFYNYSQDNISYSGFDRTPVQGKDYSYQVTATDPENDPLTYSLEKAPTGMTVDATTGLISWNQTDMTPGSQDVTVVVKDNHGNSDKQSFTLQVPTQ